MNKSIASFVFAGETLFKMNNELPADNTKEAVVLISPEVVVSKKSLSKRTLLLVDISSASDREFVFKIMSSVNILPQDIEIIQQSDFGNYDFTNLSLCREIISFGNLLQDVGLPAVSEPYILHSFGNQKIILADTLSKIGLNQSNEKRNLWAALKLAYGIA